jgi:hypothetical protein
LDETKKKRKKDRAARQALRRGREVPEDIADTDVPSSEGVLDAIVDEAAEIAHNAAGAVEVIAEENPFIAPWASSGLKEGSEPAQTKEGLREEIESAAKASLEGARAARERMDERGDESGDERLAERTQAGMRAATHEASRAMQSWTDFCLSYYSRMNPVAIQLRWMRAGAAWGEAYLEANRQLAQATQSTMNEMLKLWTRPFKRRD